MTINQNTVPSTETTTTIPTAHDIYLATVGNDKVSTKVRDACKYYAREVHKNLENGDDPFNATIKVARTVIAKCKSLDFEEDEIRTVERLLEAQVRAAKPKPAERRETLESAMTKFRHARDNNLAHGREPFEATRRAANWVWEMSDIPSKLATNEERTELERLLDAEVQAVKPIRKDTRPPVSWTDPATTTKARQKPRPSGHGPRSEPLDIRRAPEPELKQTTSPVVRLEQEIKAHKAEIKEFEREIRDGERTSDEESRKKLEELKTRLQEAEAEHARLLAEARAKKEALKTAGKKAPKEAEEEAARKKAEEKAARDAAKAASKGKHGGRRAA